MQECCLQLRAGPTEDPAGRAAFPEQHLWHHSLPLLLSKTMQPSHYCMHGRCTLMAPASLGMENLCTMQSLSRTQWCKEKYPFNFILHVFHHYGNGHQFSHMPFKSSSWDLLSLGLMLREWKQWWSLIFYLQSAFPASIRGTLILQDINLGR